MDSLCEVTSAIEDFWENRSIGENPEKKPLLRRPASNGLSTTEREDAWERVARAHHTKDELQDREASTCPEKEGDRHNCSLEQTTPSTSVGSAPDSAAEFTHTSVVAATDSEATSSSLSASYCERPPRGTPVVRPTRAGREERGKMGKIEERGKEWKEEQRGKIRKKEKKKKGRRGKRKEKENEP